MNVKNMKEVPYSFNVTIEEIKGKYAWNEHWKIGGIIQDGDDRHVHIGESIFSAITGDCLADHLCINGFKIYELPENE